MVRFVQFALMSCGLIATSVTPSAAQNHCIQLEQRSGVKMFSNSCDRSVSVRWSDQGYCRGGTCSVTVGPDSVQSVGVTGMACWQTAWGYDNPSRPGC